MGYFIKKLYKNNHDGFYVSQLLPNLYDNDGNINIKRKTQPPLEKRNPNKESIDFAILLKLNDSEKLQKQITKTFQSLPIGKKISLEKLKTHYKSKMPKEWKNNLLDLIYFFEERDCLTINENKDNLIETITITKDQYARIDELMENYIGEIIKLWPELLQDFTNTQ